MRKLVSSLFIAILLLSSLLLVTLQPTSAQGPAPTDKSAPPPSVTTSTLASATFIDRTLLRKIEPPLFRKLLQAGSPIPFIVYLRATTNLSAAVITTSEVGIQSQAVLLDQRIALVKALQQTAQASQAGVLQVLNNPLPGGVSSQAAATEIRPLWIVNAVAAQGSLTTVLTLASRPDVAIIRLDRQISLNRSATPPLTPSPLHPSTSPSLHPSILPPFQSSNLWNIPLIRADLVHQALGLDGTGVVVANIDTGVDWVHPALQSRYRGYTGPGKLPLHTGNWFDATNEGAVYPFDGDGHGTHTMGTMVGGNGIGVAPGARWIAVRAFNSDGNAQVSWLHSAFQWVLAPNGNPALAPAVVNNSWGSDISYDIEFQADVQALKAAGIFPVFSAGNNGPGASTVGSPASLNDAFSVGATDDEDEAAYFSGRGPSPWGKVKPEVAAPGKDIYSTLPGGTYGKLSGTSMAAPHVSGLAALLLQASPNLNGKPIEIARVITSTASPLDSPRPNNTYGWGRIDAYNAVMAVAPVGILEGTVTRLDTGTSISYPTLQIAPHPNGPALQITGNSQGLYRQGLAAAMYDVTASAFGYAPMTVTGLQLLTRTVVTQNFSLAPLPTGTLAGTVRDNANKPLAATISIDGTPVSATTNPSTGAYMVTLPAGVYTITVAAARHRTEQAAVTITAGVNTTLNFNLDDAPAILVVDSGKWYQASELDYYAQALADARYSFDTWQVNRPFDSPSDIPSAAQLAKYDIVIWSAPEDSPGYIGAEEVLADFLKAGGKLLLSGQDVAYYDGGGYWTGPVDYMTSYIKAGFVSEVGGEQVLSGTAGGPLAGLTFTIHGGDGANNQVSPDVITNLDPDGAGSLLTYAGTDLAGLHASLCLPDRAIFLPFGFEAISDRAARQMVLERTIDWLELAPAAHGVELTPAAETLIGAAGQQVQHTIRLRNTGATADTYQLSLTGGDWATSPASFSPVQLGACWAQQLVIAVTIDPQAAWNVADTFTVTAQSGADAALTSLVTRTTKSPAPVLLVNDGRWYEFGDKYQAALAANGLAYDTWEVPWSWTGPLPSSPPLATLQMYPMTIWFTGFDWSQPLAPAEEERLAAYLSSGGRLEFSGQDYLYNLPGHTASQFAQNYLGIQDHTEDYTSTLVVGQPGSPVGSAFNPGELIFPPGYRNWTDALTPTVAAKVATRGQDDQPNGLTLAGSSANGQAWHTVFFAYGPELLTPEAQARLMQRTVGWLSWLGSSTVVPSVSVAPDGTVVTYTATITNDGWTDLATASFTATFPAELNLLAYSTDLALVDGSLVWHGPLARQAHRTFTYTAQLADDLPPGQVVRQVNWLSYPDHNILFDRVADVDVNFPDLTSSTLTVAPAQAVEEQDMLTYTLTLVNNGWLDPATVTATSKLPAVLTLAEVDEPALGTVISSGNSISWTVSLDRQQAATLTYRAVISYRTGVVIENNVYADDGYNRPTLLTARATYKLFPYHFPVILKNSVP